MPQYDDEYRGPGVPDAYELSRCWVDLQERAAEWPLPADLAVRLIEYSKSIPEDQRATWLRSKATGDEATILISRAIDTGELPIWVAPKEATERLVATEALRDVDRRTIVSGIYRPSNDRGWLFGRPLFVKRDDWHRFLSSIQAKKKTGPSIRSHVAVVDWCEAWISKGRGNGMDAAWLQFKLDPGHVGLSRDDVFRPAWREAKTK